MRRAYTYRLAEFPVVDSRLYLINVPLYNIIGPSLSSPALSTLDIFIVRYFPVTQFQSTRRANR